MTRNLPRSRGGSSAAHLAVVEHEHHVAVGHEEAVPVGVVVRVVALASAATQAEEPEEQAIQTRGLSLRQTKRGMSSTWSQMVVHCWVSRH